jgi:small conductance mechanosensitive channel
VNTEAIQQFLSTTAPDSVMTLVGNLVGAVIAVRPHSHTDHYWQVYFDANEAVVRVCREAGWPAPTPSQIVRQA